MVLCSIFFLIHLGKVNLTEYSYEPHNHWHGISFAYTVSFYACGSQVSSATLLNRITPILRLMSRPWILEFLRKIKHQRGIHKAMNALYLEWRQR